MIEQVNFTAPAESDLRVEDDFWTRGYCADAPNLSTQLEEIHQASSARQNLIHADPRAIKRRLIGATELSEAAALKELADFLARVKEVAEAHDDWESQSVIRHIQSFENNFSFIGGPEFEAACEGIAAAWSEYLSQGSDFYINVYDARLKVSKSHDYILDAVIQKIAERSSGEGILSKIKLDPEFWEDGPNSKLIFIDDWSASGAQAGAAIESAHRTAQNHAPGLSENLELHLLIAREEQIGRRQTHNGTVYTTRAYYRSHNQESAHTVSASGQHSSVDYGFSMALESFGAYLEHHHEGQPLPILAHIDRPYNSEQAKLTEEQKEELAELSRRNSEVINLTNEVASYEALWHEALRTGNPAYVDHHARMEALFMERSKLEKRQHELESRLNIARQ